MLPKQIQVNLKKTKAVFYCYNGHGQSYTKSTADVLQEKLNEAALNRQQKMDYIAKLEQRIVELSNATIEKDKPKRKAKRVSPCQ